MNQVSPGNPSMQPEDIRFILGAICVGNWIAIAGALFIELFIRMSSEFVWPQWGYFTLSYNIVLFEFALVTLGVTVLLRRTAWLDRAPREALGRLRYLLLVVLALDGFHLLGFFETTGGIHGPTLILFPPITMALYLLLPRREAHAAVAVLLVALLLMTVMSSFAGGSPQGMLAASFTTAHALPLPWLLVVAAAVLLALVVGMAANAQYARAGTSLGRVIQRDPGTGLFQREVLERRVPGELGRIDRSASTAALLMISFRNMQELLAQGNFATYDRTLRDFANALRLSTRETSDTCARYDVSSFAALLPTASGETATLVIDRIQQACAGFSGTDGRGPGPELAIGVVSTSSAASTDPAAFINAAQEALREAQAAGAGHQVVARNL